MIENAIKTADKYDKEDKRKLWVFDNTPGNLAAIFKFLLAMLNSCAAGVSVVNIDNGFGAGRLASIINKMR